jgi:hypothetical protein
MRDFSAKPNLANLIKLTGFFRCRAVSHLSEEPVKKDAGYSDLTEIAEFLRCSALARLSDNPDVIVKTAASVYATKLLTKSLPQLIALVQKQKPKMDMSILAKLEPRAKATGGFYYPLESHAFRNIFADGTINKIDPGYANALWRWALVKLLGGRYENVETALADAARRQYARSTVDYSALGPMRPALGVPIDVENTAFRGLSSGAQAPKGSRPRSEYIQDNKLVHTGNKNRQASYASRPEIGAGYAQPINGQFSSYAKDVPKNVNPLATDQRFLTEVNLSDIDPKMLSASNRSPYLRPSDIEFLKQKKVNGTITPDELKTLNAFYQRDFYDISARIEEKYPWLSTLFSPEGTGVTPSGAFDGHLWSKTGVPPREYRNTSQQLLAHKNAIKNDAAYEIVGKSNDVPIQQLYKVHPNQYPQYTAKIDDPQKALPANKITDPNIAKRKAWVDGLDGMDDISSAAGVTPIKLNEPIDNAVRRSASFYNKYN